jgi:hypothetical protein
MTWLTVLISGGLAIFGTVVGAMIGPYFSGKSEQRKWIKDKKTQEFKELLEALTLVHLDLLRVKQTQEIERGGVVQFDPVPGTVELNSYRVLRSRLFTATELEQEQIRYRWAEAIENYKKTSDDRKFCDRFDSIVNAIVLLATKPS